MKQVDFLNKIALTSCFENMKTDFCSSVKLCTVTRAEHAGLIVFLIQLPWPITILVDIYMYIDIYIHWQHYTNIWYSKKIHFLLSKKEKKENMKKKIIDYLIDYAFPIISDNRL